MRPWAKWLAKRHLGFVIKVIWLLLLFPSVLAHWFGLLPGIFSDAAREWRYMDKEINRAVRKTN